MSSNLTLSLITCPLFSGVVVPVRFPSVGQIGLFKNDWYSIGPREKKSLKKQHKICKYERTMNAIP